MRVPHRLAALGGKKQIKTLDGESGIFDSSSTLGGGGGGGTGLHFRDTIAMGRLCVAIACVVGVSSGRSSAPVKRAAARFGLQGLVQVHHIYPRQFRNHPSLHGLDVQDAENLLLMPTHRGTKVLRLHSSRLVHDGGHNAYNKHIGRYLSVTVTRLPERSRLQHLLETREVLRAEMRNHTFVPWI